MWVRRRTTPVSVSGTFTDPGTLDSHTVSINWDDGTSSDGQVTATSSTASGLNHMPSARFAANGAWLAGQEMAHNLARWTARIGLGERDRDHQDPQAAGLRSGGTDHPLGAPPHFASPPALALGNPVQSRLGPAASHSVPGLTASLQLTQRPRTLAPPRSRESPPAYPLAFPRIANSRIGP